MLVGHQNDPQHRDEGSESPWPSHEQTVRCRRWCAGLDEGAIGVTVGYAQRHETFEEIVAVTRPAAEAGTISASHIRSEGNGLLQAVGEAIEVAHETGIAVQISHLKTNGPSNWDKLEIVLAMIEDAVDRGLDARTAIPTSAGTVARRMS